MPNNKVKTLKKIKGKDTAHPFSRKAYQMRRAVHREQRIETGVDKGKQDKQRKLDRILFFKSFIPESLLPVSMEEMHEIVLKYELLQMKINN
jgi:translation machinery-associated protein 16